MIQRIQSVYLLFAALLLLASFWLPLAQFINDGELQATQRVCAIVVFENGHQVATSIQWGTLTFTTLAIIAAIADIFLYKNRGLQLVFANWFLITILLSVLTGIGGAYYFTRIQGTTVTPAYGIIFLVLAYVLGWLARRAIRKDEEMVRAAERIR